MAAAAVFPLIPRSSPSSSVNQEASVVVAAALAAAASRAVSLVPGLAEHEEAVSPAALAANRASTLVDMGRRMMMATAHQSTLLMKTMTSRHNDRGTEAVETTENKTVHPARARHRGGVLRRQHLRPTVTSNCSTFAGLALSFWQLLSSSPYRH